MLYWVINSVLGVEMDVMDCVIDDYYWIFRYYIV